MEHIIQKEEHDCGIACILMIIENDFKIKLNYQDVRDNIEVSEKGIRLDNLVDYLNKFDAYKAYKCELNSLPNHPFITIIKLKNKYHHYIVVWKKDNKYVYYSNPSEEKINKMTISKFKKYYEGVIVFFKEKEIDEIAYTKFKLKNIKKYLLPLIFLNILEITLFTFSFLYLFNINEFNILKVGMFFSILTTQIIIYLLKNYFISLVNKEMDKRLLNFNDNDESINELKENIKKAYYLKNKKTILYNKIIPYLVITIFSFIVFFYLHFILSFSMFIFAAILYFINVKFYRKRNTLNFKIMMLENKFNKEEENINKIICNLEDEMKRLSKINNSYTIINHFFRQCIFIFVLLFFSLIKQEKFVFIGVYLCFYLFDFVTFYADYKSDKKVYKHIIYNFNHKK